MMRHAHHANEVHHQRDKVYSWCLNHWQVRYWEQVTMQYKIKNYMRQGKLSICWNMNKWWYLLTAHGRCLSLTMQHWVLLCSSLTMSSLQMIRNDRRQCHLLKVSLNVLMLMMLTHHLLAVWYITHTYVIRLKLWYINQSKQRPFLIYHTTYPLASSIPQHCVCLYIYSISA